MTSRKRQPLRFSAGDTVLARTGNGFEGAIITKCWSKEDRGLAPYRMQVVSDGNDIYTLEDSDNFVRAYVEPGMPRLLQCILCGDGAEVCSAMAEETLVNVSLVGTKLLFAAAASGNIDVVCWLADEGVDITACDKDGRNIYHIALMNKQVDFVTATESLDDETVSSLVKAADNRGFNLLHYVVMSKDVDLMRDILCNNFFDQDLLNLVDLHHKRFFRELHETDPLRKLITPIEWARRTRQPEMVELLENYLWQKLAELKLLTVSCCDAPSLASLQVILDQLTACGVCMQNIAASREIERFKELILANLFKVGALPEVEFFLKHFPYQLSTKGEFNADRKVLTGPYVIPVILGSDSQVFPDVSENCYTKQTTYDFKTALNGVIVEWDGASDLSAYLRSKRTQESADKIVFKGMHVVYDGAKWNKNHLGASCVDKFLLRAEGVNIAERAAMIEYLLEKVPATRTQLSPELFVLHSQPCLLEWAVTRGLITLHCRASSYPQLVQCVLVQPWYQTAVASSTTAGKKSDKKNKTKDSVSSVSLRTVAELLCALAAGQGEYFILKWLLENHPPGDPCSLKIGALDLLSIAASRNYLVIVKYLVAGSVFPSPQLFEACCLCLKAGLCETGSFLLEVVTASARSGDQLTHLLKLARGLQHHYLISKWYNFECLRSACHDILQLIKKNATLSAVQKCWKKHNMPLDNCQNLCGFFSIIPEFDY